VEPQHASRVRHGQQHQLKLLVLELVVAVLQDEPL
jgi:hypothetical protein